MLWILICSLNFADCNAYKTWVQSMIHSARPTVPWVVITILSWTLFCFARFWKVETDVRTDVQTTRAKIVITTGRYCGSASWIKMSCCQKRSLKIYIHPKAVWMVGCNSNVFILLANLLICQCFANFLPILPQMRKN